MNNDLKVTQLLAVVQGDGGYDWSVCLAATLEGPGGPHVVSYGPMDPTTAQSQFDIGLPDILADLNAEMIAAVAGARAEAAAAQAALQDETSARITAQDAVESATKSNRSLSDALAAEEAAHLVTSGALAEAQARLTNLRDAMLIRAVS
ncbi:hypothetical protein BH10PSE14_BH10PSE14_04240 [soil metagenome]